MRALAVLLLGLLWAVLSLALNTWSERALEFSLMGYYINFLPLGAALMGVFAGCGLGLASWGLSLHIRKGSFAVFILALLAAYWLERYAYYRWVGPLYKNSQESVPFWAYTDYLVQSWAFVQKNGSPGEALGLLGYGLLAAEMLGFCLGGIAVPTWVSVRPHCWYCGRYMKLRSLGLMPASIPWREDLVVTDKAAMDAHHAEFDAAYQKGVSAAESLKAQAQAGQGLDFKDALASWAGHDVKKLPYWIEATLQRCPHCHSGRATAQGMTRKGEQVEAQGLFQVDLTAAFVERLESAL